MRGAIAIIGDVHGHHDLMVEAIGRRQEQTGHYIDFIICVGDFQSMRDETDMRAMACPARYQQVGEYPAYHRGEKQFPAEVVFVGGNHEAYNWLEEMPAGGPLGPRCHYMGRQGVVSRMGLRIAGLTGIYSPKAYQAGRRPVDYTNPAVIRSEKAKKQSTYFAKQEVEDLAASGPVDVLVFHDWPAGLETAAVAGTIYGTPRHGVGNDPAKWLLEKLKPRWLFCGHMHQYFRGDIVWPSGEITTFACLDRVAAGARPCMCILQESDGGQWTLQVVPPR